MEVVIFWLVVALVGLWIYAWKLERRRRADREESEQRWRETHTRLDGVERATLRIDNELKQWREGGVAVTEPARAEAKTEAPRVPAATAPAQTDEVYDRLVLKRPPPASPAAKPPQPPPQIATPAPEAPHAPVRARQPEPAALTKPAAPLEVPQTAASPPPTAKLGYGSISPHYERGAAEKPTPPIASDASAAPPPAHVPPTAPPSFATVGSVMDSISQSTAKPAASAVSKGSAPSLEEKVGANWLNKLGVSILVLGVGFFLAYQLKTLGPAGKVTVGFLVSFAMLGAGVWLERKERYRIPARALIGGGWALIYFVAFAMYYVPAAKVIASQPVDLLLMCAIAAAMVWHTLRYDSQVVTGLAFLLGFATVTIHRGADLSMAATALLALGLIAIVLWRRWYELEVFGILAAYLSHFLWLQPIIDRLPAGTRAFPQYGASTALLVLYWAAFRASYVLRSKINDQQENVSTVAALLNGALFLGLMKYQAVHPEWAFGFLLTLGAVEFVLGQLPITRRRRMAFILLTIIGTSLMVAALPFRFADQPSRLAVLWLAEAEVLFLAGVAAREVVFRRMGLLTALVAAVESFVTLNYTGYSNAHAAVVFGVAAAIFYADALAAPRRWPWVAEAKLDRYSLISLSYVGALMAGMSMWVALPDAWIGVGWMALALVLMIAARRFQASDVGIQAYALAAIGLVRLLGVNLDMPVAPAHFNLRIITMFAGAALLYLASNWSGAIGSRRAGRMSLNTAAALLVAVLLWHECAAPWLAVAWIGLAVLWMGISRWFDLSELKVHAAVIACASIIAVLVNDLGIEAEWHRLSLRLVTIALTAVGLYIMARWSELPGPDETTSAIRPVYSWAGTVLVALLCAYELRPALVAVGWAAMAFVLLEVSLWLRSKHLQWQSFAVLVASVVRVLLVNIRVTDASGVMSVRLYSILPVVAILYYVYRRLETSERVPAAESARLFAPAFTWAASFLVGLLMWYELRPIAVAPAWAVFGLVLLELGFALRSRHLRLQSYCALLAAFARIFFVNLNASGVAGEISPRFYTTLPLALIFFYAYTRLVEHAEPDENNERGTAAWLLAYCGTTTVVALSYFELDRDWVAAAWGGLVLALVAVAWKSERRVFVQQGVLLSFAVVWRAINYNLLLIPYFSADPNHSRTLTVGAAIAGLAAAMGVTFGARRKDEPGNWLAVIFDRRPEQPLFFAAVGLLTVMLGFVMRSGMITVSWGVEAVGVFLFALWVNQRSFRLAGLGLLLLCVAKILFIDFWALALRDKWITLIILGAALMLVSFLYSRHRETIRQYL